MNILSQVQYEKAKPMFDAGLRSHQGGDLDTALNFWQNAIEVFPGYSAAIMNAGTVFRDQGKHDLAIRYFQEAIKIQPDSAFAYYNLASTFCEIGDYKAAVNHFLKVIKIQPDFEVVHGNLDAILFDILKDPDFGVACYKKMREGNPLIDNVGPRRVRLETSSVCNLRCRHCPTGTDYGHVERRVMSMEIFEKILEQLKTIPILSEVFLYVGGEPLVNRNLAVMCQRIKAENPKVLTSFNTNAMLLDEKVCNELAKAKVSRINISVDGRSPEENDMIRRGAKYEKIVNNVNVLRSVLVETQINIVNTVFKKSGDPQTPETPEYLQRDFSGLSIQTTYAMKWPGLNLESADLEYLAPCVSDKVDNFCKMPFTELAIRPNGDVTLCCYDLVGEHVMGNIEETALMEIWKSERYRDLRVVMLARKKASLPGVCKKCQHYNRQKLITVTHN